MIRLKQCILPVFCFVFSLLVYGPTELYLSNQGSEEFWFSFSEVVVPYVVLFLVAFAVIMGILMILPAKCFRVIIGIITAIDVLLLLQGLFLPNSYGSLNGNQIEWNQYTLRSIYNTAIWIALIVVAAIYAFRKWDSFRKMSLFAVIVVLVIQAATLVTLGVSVKPDQKAVASSDVYLTTQKEFTVSSDQNTIVFILDAFDSQIMYDLLEEYPDELYSSFEDFTYYHNTNGGATRTKYAIPYILTGKTNDTGGTYSEYLSESFQESPLFQELRTGAYDTGFYTEYGYVDRTQTKAIDNLSISGNLQATSQWGLSTTLLKLTAFKYMPHILKQYFWMYSFDLAKWRGGDGEYGAYGMNDILFYQQLTEKGLSSTSDSKDAFRFIHLKGAHGPFTMDENIQSVPQEQNSSKQQSLGALRIVSAYIQQLKKLGIYDNSTIFIMADHGDRLYGKPNYEQNPLFMIKEAKTRKAFSISDMRLSYRDVSNMMAMALRSQLYVSEYETKGTRYFYSGSESNNTYRIIEYASDGDAYDTDSYYTTGKEYIYQDNDISYALGTTLYFGENGGSTAKKHFVNGFTYPESDYVWTNGKNVELKFDIGSIDKNLLISFDYTHTINDFQRVYLYVGDLPVASFITRKPTNHQFVIPRDAVIDGVLDITFKLPDAYSPLAEGTGIDSRILALAFNSIKIEQCDLSYRPEEQHSISSYTLGQEIVFGPDGNMDRYAVSGVSNDHCTSGNRVKLFFDAIKTDKNLVLEMAYKIFGEKQRVIMFANGKKINEYIATEEETKKILVPYTLINDGTLSLEINLPDASKPNSGDGRDLALWMKTILLRQIDDEQDEFADSYYPLGQILSFNTDEIKQYMNSGFSKVENWGTWMTGQESQIFLTTDDVTSDLNLMMDYNVIGTEQHIQVYINGYLCDEFSATEDETKDIRIPKEYIKDNTISIIVSHPDAISPKAIGVNDDSRELSLGMKRMCISEYKENE